MVVTYCTSNQVAQFLQRALFTDAPDTTPSKTVVEELINRNEDFIDEETGHAWRTRTITDEFIEQFVFVAGIGYAFNLRHRVITTISTGAGDKIQIFDGSNFIDYAATKTSGRAEDFFVDETNGVIYIRDRSIFYPKGNKFTYRYGDTTVARDIEKACILLTAADILTMLDKSGRFADDGPSSRISHRDRIELWQQQANDILDNKREIQVL